MQIPIIRLDHVQICIPLGGEDQARTFYSDILGFTELEKPESLKRSGGLWYQAGDIQVHIGVEKEYTVSKRHPAFEIRKLKESRKYLESRGVNTKDEDPVPGQERFTFRDPFGNRIEFLEKTG